jgi:hypothetical protein
MLSYGQPYVIGPFPISGGNLTLHLCDHDVINCCTTVSVTAPAPCSSGGGGGGGNPCDNVVFTPGSHSITVSGLTAPIEIVKVFNSGWQPVFECTANCADPTVVTNLSLGTYFVKVQMFNSTWHPICVKEGYVTVNNIVGDGNDDQVYLNSSDEQTPAAIENGNSLRISNSSQEVETGDGVYSFVENPIAPVDPVDLHIFPNPAGNYAILHWGTATVWQKAELTLFNSLGQQVKSVEIEDVAQGSIQLDLGGLRDGNYIVHFRAEGQTPLMKKLIITR